MQLASIPSPSQSVWHLGPLPIRAYALCIVLGIVVALWMGARRMRERGGAPEDVWDVAGWAIVLGIIGGRLYHIVTDPELYFEGKPGTSPINAFKIWDGGLGIWGAIALGTLGAWIGCRRKGISLLVFADAVSPGVLVAQAIGRWGNWFNNELYGGPTSVPWKLEIHCLDVTVGHAQPCTVGGSDIKGYFQPTFLYESLWSLAVVALILYLDRRYRLGRGNVMALYVMGYTLGRVWIEALRTDTANHILGLRLNIWTAIIVFLCALAWFVKHGGFHSGREETPYTRPRVPKDAEVDEPAATDTDTASVPAGEPATDDEPGDVRTDD